MVPLTLGSPDSMPATEASIDAARPPTRTLALRRSPILAPLSGLIEGLAEMVDGFRRHIPHPAMVTEEVSNPLCTPDQVVLFRHLLNEPRNEILTSNVSGYHRSATGIRCQSNCG